MKNFIEHSKHTFYEQQHKFRKKFFDMVMNQDKIDGSGILTLGKFLEFCGAKLEPQDEVTDCNLPKSKLIDVFQCAKLCEISYDLDKIIPEDFGKMVFNIETEKPGHVPTFMVFNKKDNILYVVMRGTFCFQDIITDLTAISTNWNDGYMHYGIMKAGLNAAEAISNKFDEILSQNENVRIIFTGHSLGAGAAAIAYLHMKEKKPICNYSAILFAPPPTMSENIWEKTINDIISFHLHNDPVPFLSLHNAALAASNSIKYQSLSQKLKKIAENDLLIPPGQVYKITLLSTNPIDVKLGITNTSKHYSRLPKEMNETLHYMPLYKKCIQRLLFAANEII